MTTERQLRFNGLLHLVKDDKRSVQLVNFLGYLQDHSSYFTAPASPGYHCSWEGGLLDHSMNVAYNALELNGALHANLNQEELVIAGLFHDCLPGYVKVNTLGGDKPIKDVNVGDLLNIDGQETFVVNKWNTGKKSCLHIETEYGYSIDASEDHKFAVIKKDGNLEFVKAGDLVKGDILVLKETGFGIKYVPEAYLIGYIIGDGWLSSQDNSVNVKVSDVDRGSRIYEEFINIGGKVYEDVNPGDRVVMDKLYYCDEEFRHKLELYGLTNCGALYKRVPEVIYKSDKVSVREFLKGLYDSDGSVSVKKDGSYINVNIGSISKDLLVDVQRLLLKFGVRSKLHLLRQARDILGPQGTIIHCLDIYNLVIEGPSSIIKFRDEIGFSLDRKQSKLVNFEYGFDGRKVPGVEHLIKGRNVDRNLIRRVREGKDLTKKSLDIEEDLDSVRDKIEEAFFSNVRIKSIEDIGEKDCYDIEVEGQHTFIAEGFYVHNCGKAYIAEDEPYYLIKNPTSQQAKYGYVAYPPFGYNQAGQIFMPVPQRSVRLITQFIDISDECYAAILTHDGQYVPENKPYACKESPMQLILHYADSWAGFYMEGKTAQTPDGKGYVAVVDDKVGKHGSDVRVSQTDSYSKENLWR